MADEGDPSVVGGTAWLDSLLSESSIDDEAATDDGLVSLSALLDARSAERDEAQAKFNRLLEASEALRARRRARGKRRP